jgi:hypothetical protein
MRPCYRYPRLWIATLLIGGLAMVSGCLQAPDRITWHPDQPVIAPSGSPAPTSGMLVVETVSLGNDNGTERRRNFFLYDEKGSFLTHYNNDYMSEISLPAGRYVVVSGVFMANKQVQVMIRDGYTTRVTLKDLKDASVAN